MWDYILMGVAGVLFFGYIMVFFIRRKEQAPVLLHQTVQCPHCGKDSWRTKYELPAECMWCRKIITLEQI